MAQSAQEAFQFIERLYHLASRLTERDIVVAALDCQWGSFGSWTLEVQKGPAADAYAKALLSKQWDTSGPEVRRVSWDGREGLLTIEAATTPPLTSPGPWTRELDQGFDNPQEVLPFVEDFLKRWGDDGP